LDDIPADDPIKQVSISEPTRPGVDMLVGHPLSEVERYYKERALEMTAGNREEAARLLGIGERTLYRDIQEWKLQDKIKEALASSDGDLPKAAAILGMKPDALEKKLKKLGQRAEEE
jgi:DNA-binding NtrC family response regulator